MFNYLIITLGVCDGSTANSNAINHKTLVCYIIFACTNSAYYADYTPPFEKSDQSC